MSEPRFVNYLQLHTTSTDYKWIIMDILKHADINIKFSRQHGPNLYCMINTKNKSCIWNSIKTEAKVKIIDAAFMEQLKFLEVVGKDAQAAYLLDPV